MSSQALDELQMYPIDPQPQHEELVATRQALETSATDFAQLFLTAPVGLRDPGPRRDGVRINQRAQAMFAPERPAAFACRAT